MIRTEPGKGGSLKKRRKRWWILICSVLVLLIAVMIFLFSAQDGLESSNTSTGVVVWVIQHFYPTYPEMTRRQQAALMEELVFKIRKLAHFLEFAMLGVSLRLLFHALRLRLPLMWAWLAGTLYAVSDEVHQMFVAARGPAVTDVMIDSAGVLTMACVTSLILLIRKRIKQKKDPEYV